MPDRTPSLDLLPPAYIALRQHWHWSKLQAAAVLLLAAGLLLGVVRVRAELRRASEELSQAEMDLATARVDQQKLESLTRLRDQWRRQEHLLSSAGTHVEPSRMLVALERVVPGDTVLTDLSFELLNRHDSSSPSRAGPARIAPSNTGPGDDAFTLDPTSPGDFKVTLRGLAPGEPSVGNLLTALSKTPIFRRVNLNYAKDNEYPGVDRPLREFEVTFRINLTTDSEIASSTSGAR